MSLFTVLALMDRDFVAENPSVDAPETADSAASG